MSSTYHYNSDSYASGLENIVAQTYWSIHFSHVPTGRATFFEAFLTDFTDNFSSNWNTQTVFGRMDPIATFQNTQRTIKFGFNVLAESDEMAADNLHRFQHLASFLYPTYEQLPNPSGMGGGSSGILTMNQAPLIRIKFANLIQDTNGVKGSKGKPAPQTRNAAEAGLVGFVQGFNFTPKIESGFFSGGPGVFYPMEYGVSVDFTVLHNHSLGWSQKKKWVDKNSSAAFPNGDGSRPIDMNRRDGSEAVPIGKRVETITNDTSSRTTATTGGKDPKEKVSAATNKRVLGPSNK